MFSGGDIVFLRGSIEGKIIKNTTGSFVIPICGGNRYTVSLKNKSVIFSCTTSEYPEIGMDVLDAYSGTSGKEVFEKVIKTSKNARYLILNFPRGAGEFINDTMLNIGEKALPYEPYTKQSLTYPTPNGLPGIPVSSGGNYTDESGQQWVCDEVDFERKVYVKRIQREEITFNRDVFNTPIGFRYTSKQNSKKLSRQYTEVISERFKYSDKAGIASLNDKNGIRASSEYNIIVAQDQETIAETPSVTTFVYYIIENTEEIPLAPAELSAYAALHTNYPTTTILTDSGAGVEVEYVADTQHYIEKLLTATQQRISALEANAIGG